MVFDGPNDKTTDVNGTGTFWDLQINRLNNNDVDIASGDVLFVLNDLTLTEGRVDVGTLSASGNVTIESGHDSSNADLKFVSDGDQTFDLTGATGLWDGDITIDKSGGTVTLASDVIMNSGVRDFYLIAGTFDLASYELEVIDDFNQSGGTFTGNTGTLDVLDFILSGGTFTATSGTSYVAETHTHTAGGTFNHGGGWWVFDGGNDKITDVNGTGTFWDLQINRINNNDVDIASGDVLFVLNDLALTEGKVDVGTLSASGNVTVASTFDGGTGTATLKFVSDGSQTFDLTGGTDKWDGHVAVDKSGGAVTLASTFTLNSSDSDFTIIEGTLDLDGNNFTVNSDWNNNTFIVEDGGTWKMDGDETLSFETNYPQLDFGNTVEYDGFGTHTIGDYTYHHLTTSGTGVYQMGAAETLGGSLTISSGTFSLAGNNLVSSTGTFSNDGTLRLQGGETITLAAMDTNSGTVEFTGNGNAGPNTYTITDLSTTYYNLTLNSTDGTTDKLQLGAALDVNNDLTLTAGTFDSSTSSHGVTVGGSWTDTGAGIFDERSGTVTFDGTGTLNSNEPFEYLVINTSGTVTLGAALDADKEIKLTAGTFDVSSSNYGITSGSGWIDSGAATFVPQSGTVTFDNSGIINSNDSFNNLDFNKGGGTFTLGQALDLNGQMKLTAGELDVSSSNYGITVGSGWVDSDDGNFIEQLGRVTFDGTGIVTTNEPFENVTINTAGTITLGSNFDADGEVVITAGTFDVSSSNYGVTVGSGWVDSGAGTFVEQAGTVTFDGTGAIYSNEAFNNVTIFPMGVGLLTLGTALDVDGNLSLNGGELDVSDSNYGITVGGTWMNDPMGGVFTQGEGTVTFDGSGTGVVAGSTAFYNFTCTTAGKVLTFDNMGIQTVTGALTLTGADGNLLVLRSDVPDQQWGLKVNGTSSVDYVDVMDSDASTGNAITHAVDAARSTDSGNNLNWSFNDEPTVTTVTGTQATDGSGGVTVSFIADDADDDDTLQAVVEYNTGGGWTKATISETSGTSATYDSYNAENDNVHQLGNSNGYITTSSGANTVTATWNSATDEATADLSTAQVRVYVYDGTGTGTVGTSSNFIMDNVDPSGGLTSLGSSSMKYNTFTLSWDAVTTETNFNKYQVYYKLSSASTYALFGEDTTMTTTSMGITGLAEGTGYDFYVKAVDDYGNSLTGTATSFTTIDTDNPYFGAVTGGSASTGESTSTTTTSTEDGGEDDAVAEEEDAVAEADEEEEAEEEEEEEEYIPIEVEVVIEIEEEEIAEIVEDPEAAAEVVEEIIEEAWEEEEVTEQLSGHWAEPYLKDFYEATLVSEINDISLGTSIEATVISYLFDPEQKMSRVDFLRSAMDLLEVDPAYDVSKIPFSDMDFDSEGIEYVISAHNMGVISGYPDGTFNPDGEINRAEALKIIFMIVNEDVDLLYGDDLLDYYYLPSNPFPDVDIDAWYAPYIVYAYMNGIVSGYGDGYFRPDQQIALGEMAKIITLVMEMQAQEV